MVALVMMLGGSAYDDWFSCASNQVTQVLLTLPYSCTQLGMLERDIVHSRPVVANRHHTRVSVAVRNSLHGCDITPEFVRAGADLNLPKQLADKRISSHMFTWMKREHRAEPGVVVLLAHDGHYINAIRKILRLGHMAVLIYKGRVNGELFKLPWSGKIYG
ncbi:hypothetical protein ISN44_As07g002750 [Arabidopsis suecica]|uniref:Uncharacterized protein n=1 Tax=Arabidopsis suecica TaxID=45249 RepID=A0A8T2BWR7_ARASU|nr:hypothetical protein ISN44_As07g002750 [Arabidopsis suecica]